jgi:zinc transport system substrate-binding protein
LSRLRIQVFVLALAGLWAFLPGCQREGDSKPIVIASTTMIASVAREIAGDRIEVTSLVPAGMCPGHFDIKPRQMEDIEKADLFMYHGWESWLPKIIEAAGGDLQVAEIGIEGNWMVPEIHIDALDSVLDILVWLDPLNDDLYRERALVYENSVLGEARSLCDLFEEYQDTPVICSELQAEFLGWAGFDVLATYDRAEDISPKTMEYLIETGRRNHVTLVADNLQSGPRVGERIADEIDAEHVILTNFPLNGSYLKAIEDNAKALTEKLQDR